MRGPTARRCRGGQRTSRNLRGGKAKWSQCSLRLDMCSPRRSCCKLRTRALRLLLCMVFLSAAATQVACHLFQYMSLDSSNHNSCGVFSSQLCLSRNGRSAPESPRPFDTVSALRADFIQGGRATWGGGAAPTAGLHRKALMGKCFRSLVDIAKSFDCDEGSLTRRHAKPG